MYNATLFSVIELARTWKILWLTLQYSHSTSHYLWSSFFLWSNSVWAQCRRAGYKTRKRQSSNKSAQANQTRNNSQATVSISNATGKVALILFHSARAGFPLAEAHIGVAQPPEKNNNKELQFISLWFA